MSHQSIPSMQPRCNALPAEDDCEEDGAGRRGDFAFALSPHVSVELVRRGPDLVVSFAGHGRPDVVAALAGETGWSCLGICADRPIQLRSDPVTSFFDALVDGTLLDEFDSVTFVGGGAFADAALGYALSAPGARIVALGLPDRPTSAGRYPITPEFLSAASACYLVHDPRDILESGAADALAGAPIIALPLRFGAGARLDALVELGALKDVLAAAVAGALDPMAFFRILRARRSHNPYLRSLAARTTRRAAISSPRS